MSLACGCHSDGKPSDKTSPKVRLRAQTGNVVINWNDLMDSYEQDRPSILGVANGYALKKFEAAANAYCNSGK